MKPYKLNLLITFLLFTLTNINAQEFSESFTASINGTIENSVVNPSAMISSENGKYWCTFRIDEVTDEMRELSNLKFYENENFLFSLAKVPGSDLEISNSGFIVFYDHSEHYKGKLKILAYSADGDFFFEKSFKGATLFKFSSSGNLFGVKTPDGINIISLDTGSSSVINIGLQFAIDETTDGNETIAVAERNKILLYKKSELIRTINLDMELPRKVIIAPKHSIVGVIDKYNLIVYSTISGDIIFEDQIGGEFSFRDLKIVDDKIIAGIHKRNKEESTGSFRVYNLNGNLLNENLGETKSLKNYSKLNLQQKSQSGYDPIPWPFFPFDSMRTVWNHYEQHMGLGGNDSYLHQGLDLITPIGEPTFSVIDGYVKLVLTLGGASYWRTAVSDTQVAGISDGWLSAHLIENTIQFDIGDTVQVHDYLGDIIEWSSTWGHIHFVEIKDSGLVWFYADDEWGINFNPMLALQPYPDTTAPYIDPVFGWSKFAFAINESAIYLQPDSLFGEIDIIVKVVDYAGDSEWQQPAYTTWYTIKRISDNEIIKPKTLGHILNHKYPFYDGGNYQPYAGVIYQRDNTLPPSGWSNEQRNYYHNLTNSNGDSLVELSEKALAFDTDNFQDGEYKIIVEVYDEAGNFDIDSMDVQFKNGNPVKTENEEGKIYTYSIEQNYPNPFNPNTTIRFTIPQLRFMILKVYDVLGNEIAILVNEEKPAGSYEVEWNATNFPSGVYFYQLKAGSFIQTKKMLLIK